MILDDLFGFVRAGRAHGEQVDRDLGWGIETARHDVTGARRARLAGKRFNAFIATAIAAGAVQSPEAAAHGVVEGHAVGAELMVEALKKLTCFACRIDAGGSFSRQLDKLVAQPSEDFLAHADSFAMNGAILLHGGVRINANPG